MNRAMLSQGDNVAHFLYQLDNDYLKLRAIWPLGDIPMEAEALARLRLRHDIFVSRIGVLRHAVKGRDSQEFRDVLEALRQADAFVVTADEALGSSAGPGPSMPRLVTLRQDLLSLEPAMHALTLDASRIVSAHATQAAEAERTHSQLGLALSILLALVALGFGIFAARYLRDLQRRRRTLEALTTRLRQAQVDADAASAAKSAFLANMSHEIRTPFQGLQGMLRLLQQSPLDPKQSSYLRTAIGSSEHLLTLLNDILDMSRLESGRLKLVDAVVDLRELMTELEALMRPQAQGKGLNFSVDVDARLPPRVVLDPTRLRQVMFNLTSNAIKFTLEGGVSVCLRAPEPGAGTDAATSAGNRLVFTVTDTGIGMDEATVSRLFQRFSQGDDSLTRRFGGAGLGLEISRNLARLLGGDITVVSHPGKGSTFTFEFALREADGSTGLTRLVDVPISSTPSLQPLKVLVAEDNEVNRMVMEAILQDLGHAVSFAEDGEQAVQRVVQESWDIILMDLHMPVKDGLEAAHAIRALADPERARIPIVALTADVFEETRQRCAAAGVEQFLAKPVNITELAACLDRVAQAAG